IIDTPGFGDTRGPEWDQKITEQIKEAFETKVLDLNAICFVASSSHVRLTASQRYVFGNIINLFGKDVKKHFIAMLTFCDGEDPQVINSLKSKDCIFSTIIPEIDNPWYFKFNNSAIYKDNTEDVFTQMFWKLGMKSFDDFITKLVNLPRISLEQSREVLKSRECIKAQLDAIKISLNIGFSKMNEIKEIYEQLYLNREKVKNNENFIMTTDVTVEKKVDLKKGEVVLGCLKCDGICHDPCHCPHVFEDGEEKVTCYLHQNESGNCVVCGHSHKDHRYWKYRIVYETVKKQETLEDVFERYNEGKKKCC
ncbi:Hypothetical protein EHI5A_247670, partial [Entamoeba histolytica KU27]